MRLIYHLCFISFVILALCSCNTTEEHQINIAPLEPSSIHLDAEKIEGKHLVHGTTQYGHSATQSSDFAHNGKYSVRVDEFTARGFIYELQNLQIGERITVSVWRKTAQGQGRLVISSKERMWVDVIFSTDRDQNGWELLQYSFKVMEMVEDKISIRTIYTDGDGPVYFDDLKIERFPKAAPTKPMQAVLSIDIPDSNWQKIVEKRNEAVKSKVLIDPKWTSGTLITEADTFDIDIRLKGDWTDHLKGDKWSMRIKLKKGERYLEMSTFSIQDPQTRGNMNEWIFHQMLTDEQIITTKYNFATVSINGNAIGIFAVEEHFTTEMMLNNNVEPSVILKYEEDYLWYGRYLNKGTEADRHPFYEAAKARAFGWKKVKNDEVLLASYVAGSDLMYQSKFLLGSAAEVYNLEKLALYHAIVDVNRSTHGLIWHNQRWYYNKQSDILEPIGFDGYSENEQAQWQSRKCINCSANWSRNYHQYYLLKEDRYANAYFMHLERLSDEQYINSFYTKHKSELHTYATLLMSENKGWNVEVDQLKINAAFIRTNVDFELERSNVVGLKTKRKDTLTYFMEEKEMLNPIQNVAIQAFTNDSSITVFNFFPARVVLIGFGSKDSIYQLENDTLLPYNILDEPVRSVYKKGEVRKYVHFQYEEQKFKSKVAKFRAPEYKKSPSQI